MKKLENKIKINEILQLILGLNRYYTTTGILVKDHILQCY